MSELSMSDKMRIIQELVPGKQITLAHIIANPDPTLYEKLGLDPQDVVMIGNDVGDDMVAETIGMRVFLLTDCLINKGERNINDFTHGDFAELSKFMEEIINE